MEHLDIAGGRMMRADSKLLKRMMLQVTGMLSGKPVWQRLRGALARPWTAQACRNCSLQASVSKRYSGTASFEKPPLAQGPPVQLQKPRKSALRAPKTKRPHKVGQDVKHVSWDAPSTHLVENYKAVTLSLTETAPLDNATCDDCGERLPMELVSLTKRPASVRCVHCQSCKHAETAPSDSLIQGADLNWRLQMGQEDLVFVHRDGRVQSKAYVGCPGSVATAVEVFQRRLAMDKLLGLRP
eukprot:TRINITY_DN22326_c0_g2_i1.p1 TRINITY_DN22326_c0_g2~~TRINITY_DN22326_c0_g2_i1.p1  ORF type:complete len:271 (+),score=35.30 TRINITY_DN22326_c0_g2_i1:91-813(+)